MPIAGHEAVYTYACRDWAPAPDPKVSVFALRSTKVPKTEKRIFQTSAECSKSLLPLMSGIAQQLPPVDLHSSTSLVCQNKNVNTHNSMGTTHYCLQVLFVVLAWCKFFILTHTHARARARMSARTHHMHVIHQVLSPFRLPLFPAMSPCISLCMKNRHLGTLYSRCQR